MTVCNICNRPLTNPESVRVGMGPICAARYLNEEDDMEQPILMNCGTLESEGLVCDRNEHGTLICNIPQVIKYHSPTGFECGYNGSGPADLALNVLHRLIPVDTTEGVTMLDKKAVNRLAWDLHQDFKREFIAAMGKNGGEIPIKDIMQWIQTKKNERTDPV